MEVIRLEPEKGALFDALEELSFSDSEKMRIVKLLFPQFFKVLGLNYIRINDKNDLCPLADYLSRFLSLRVLEVRYNPRFKQGIIIVRCDHEYGEKYLNHLLKQYRKMERRIGEKFEYDGVTLEVAVAPYGNHCSNCYFLLNDKCAESMDITGKCSESFRKDQRSVYFKEVKK